MPDAGAIAPSGRPAAGGQQAVVRFNDCPQLDLRTTLIHGLCSWPDIFRRTLDREDEAVGLIQTIPPAVRAVRLAEAKAHARIDDAENDALLAGYIRSATASIEQYLGMALIT